jgi:hypothetical protein
MKLLIIFLAPLLFADPGPCKQDIQKFCKDVKPGGGRLIECLKTHENELSAACKEKRSQLKEGLKGVHEACKQDVEKFCGQTHPGGGRVVECLKAHENEISSQCKIEREKLKSEIKKN